MEATEVRKLAALEDTHWWYAERRRLLRRELRNLAPGVAVDVGAAGGGNTRVLRDAGWRAVALEYGPDGAEVARGRGLTAVRGDATALPFRSASVDLVLAFDVLEHLQDDAAAVAEVRRVLRPGGTYLVAVPADMALWSAHDEAVGHVRRYARPELVDLISSAGLEVQHARSWNVLLRPVAKWHRRTVRGSDLQRMRPVVNAGLRGVVALERLLRTGSLPGVSLLLRATAPR
ncbi:MAG: class I SAM-dependent methyltransferase [Actinomycetota bacterium]|nr:class I SAM-dependent methyltransferase [Actinomycetota bacterium]